VKPTRKLTLLLTVVAVVAVAAGLWALSRPDPAVVFRDSLEQLEHGNQDAVLEGIKTLEAHAGFESHVALLRGGYQLRRGHPGDAMRSFDELQPVGELRKPALELTGECLFLLDQLPLAAAQFQELLKDNPRSADAHRWLGQIFYNLGAFDTAVSHLQELIKLEPDNYLAHALIGHMAFDFEDFKVAVENYRKALSMERPEGTPARVHQEVLRNLARSLIGQNNYPEALDILESAEPDHALVLALKADCHRGLGHSARARQLLDQALKQDPNQRVAVLLQVDMAVDRKQTAAVVAPLQRILEADPHDTACRYQLAQAWQRLGEPDKYKLEMERHERSNKLKQELTEKNLQANRAPDHAEVRDRLAEICESLGKPELAAMWRQAAAACRRLPQPLPPRQPRPTPAPR
jgi:tetratricopeptide (TPR) repeat protein